jgi:uncharacterized protein (DUF433 family)
MVWQERIVLDPNVLVGKPVIRGTRLSVEFVVGLVANGWTEAQILENYPGVTRDDVTACLRYAHMLLQQERVYPVPA